jgi:hypothetical protein
VNIATDNVSNGVNSIENKECLSGRVTLVSLGEWSQVRSVRPVVTDDPSFRELYDE